MYYNVSVGLHDDGGHAVCLPDRALLFRPAVCDHPEPCMFRSILTALTEYLGSHCTKYYIYSLKLAEPRSKKDNSK